MAVRLVRFASCPGCHRATALCRVLFSISSFETVCRVRKCSDCGLVFKDHHPPEPELLALYSADYVHFQAPSPPGPAEINSVRQKLRRCIRLVHADRPNSELRILDVGCGAGSVVHIARHLGFAAYGIDPHLPARLENGILRRADLHELTEEQFDIVLLLNVAEHVIQPHPLFAAARRVLRPGGAMLLTCPYGESAALNFYRDRWTHVALDEHLLFWTPRSLRRVLAEAGFHGPSRIRIAGSPFPFGRADPAPLRPPPQHIPSPPAQGARVRHRVQESLWHFGRRLQRFDRIAVAVQAAVHALRLGDYLEYAASVGEASQQYDSTTPRA